MRPIVKLSLLVGLFALLAVNLSACNEPEAVVLGKAVAILNNKAQGYMQNGQPAAAVARLEAARDLNPQQVATLQNLAVAYQENGQYQQAADTYKELMTATPSNEAQWLEKQGIAFEALADKQKAEAQALKEPATEPETKPKPETLLSQADEAYNQALQAFEAAYNKNSKNSELKEHIDSLKRELGQDK
jgi:tetratricopeptide (TPR) repeat protein